MRTSIFRNHQWILVTAAVGVVLFLSASRLPAQQTASDERGVTAYAEARGSTSRAGQVLIVDSNIGYAFNRHVEVDVGIPVYFLRFTSPGQPHSWAHQLGDPYADVILSFENPVLNYTTAVTGSVPAHETGSFSTGRFGVDWFNHFDHQVWRFDPFANASIANGILNTRLLSTPARLVQDFRSLGFIADFEGGSTFKIWQSLGVGGSYYALVPSGPQKVYSDPNLNNPFLFPNGTSDLSLLTHDRGYTAWVKFAPIPFLYTSVGYAHSLKFNDNAATVTVGIDFRSMIRKTRTPSY